MKDQQQQQQQQHTKTICGVVSSVLERMLPMAAAGCSRAKLCFSWSPPGRGGVDVSQGLWHQKGLVPHCQLLKHFK
eukprot:129869-Amphidinium_carterae.2